MRKLFGFVALLTVLAGATTAQAQTYCNDGTYSQSHDSGTCSHHGGERK